MAAHRETREGPVTIGPLAGYSVTMTRLLSVATLLAVLACASPTGPAGDLRGNGATGLTGEVLRGPVTPVCRVDVPCDAPFSAWFDVLGLGDALMARFHSDSSGAFRVALAPGGYVVVPSDSAPLMRPRAQRKDVIVGRDGFTRVTLDFDTGIR